MDVFRSIVTWGICILYMMIMFPLNFFVWLLTFPFDRKKLVVHWLLVHQSLLLKTLIPFWKMSVDGKHNTGKGKAFVIIANHQSMLDILFINTLCLKYKWISKIENSKVPVIGWYLKMAGYVTINRGNDESKAEMMEKSLKYLHDGVSIMIFPEGTRSIDSEIGFFKMGAFTMALMADVPILPIILDGTGGILPKHGWIMGNGSHIKIRVLDPVSPSLFGTDKPEELAEKFRKLYTSELVKLRNEQ